MPAAVERPFTYLAEGALEPGTLVEAKLMGRKLIGAVWEDAGDDVPLAKLKPIERAFANVPPLSAAFRRFIDWVAEFTLAPKGAVLALTALSLAGKTPRKNYEAPDYKVNLPTLTPPQQEAADALLALLSPSPLRGEDGRGVGQGNASPRPHPNPPPKGEGIKPILLDGVTGSGKTEVYFHAIAEALKTGRQVLVLVPEIALTHQWFERFARTFGAPPTVWHSQESPAARTRVWQAVALGRAKVVVGARSALFLPFRDLGLIIVDEEQDPSYKQEEGVLYHARDMAVVRAKFEAVPVLLVSATPSLETLHNVEAGRYRMLHLPERFGAAGLPEVELVDMTLDPPERGEFLSPRVKEKILATVASGHQALLFLNRRGYAPLLLCRACGHRFECEHCSAWLVVHGKKELLCHHCGHHEKIPAECPKCHAPAEKLAPCGPGVERIAEEVRAMFPSSPLRGEEGWGADLRKAHPLAGTLRHAQALRREMTEAEKRLWKILRGKSLGVAFRKQHPVGPYIADFACLSPKLVVELDGGQHATPEDAAYDKERTGFLESQGFPVVRFWNHEVLENSEGVAMRIAQAIQQQKSPHPNPPPEGEGRVPRIAILSSDEQVASETWAAIEKGEIDILVGTQMAAKGHHFPHLTFVAVVDADIGLTGSDLRTAERTYQLLHQLGGRAGRADAPGTVFIQTYQPTHPVMQALKSHDRDRIMSLEAMARRAGGWPPYGQLAAILLDGADEAKVREAGRRLAQSAPQDARLTVLGPAPAPLSRLRDQYRYRLLVKAQKGVHLQRTLKAWLAGKKFSGVRIKLDVNPYYFQ
ncbi:MAG: primosomal protein N' [Alphaproteobacteria bacterium]